MTLRRLLTRLPAFQRDEGGNTVLSFALTFPAVLLAVFGSATLIQILWLKLMFSSGVYDAVQYITYEGGQVRYGEWRGRFESDETRRVIWERLPDGTNFLAQFAPNATNANAITLTITPPDRAQGRQYPCEGANTAEAFAPNTLKFNVTASLEIGPLSAVPFLRDIPPLTLTEQASGFVDCPRWTLPEGIRREKQLFPGFFPPQR